MNKSRSDAIWEGVVMTLLILAALFGLGMCTTMVFAHPRDSHELHQDKVLCLTPDERLYQIDTIIHSKEHAHNKIYNIHRVLRHHWLCIKEVK